MKGKKDLITVKGVSKYYGKEAVLEDISFTVSSGSMVVIIGPNGAGKTTLIKIMLGMEQPTSGKVTVAGRKLSEIREKIGYVPQRFTFDKSIPMTVYEFLMLAACDYKEHSREDMVFRALQDVGLDELYKQKMATLSGGQFQRVMIARALMHDKSILILDEPSAGVDVAAEKNIYGLIKKLNKTKGITVIIISHELDIVFNYASDVICINKKLICQGVPKKVITNEVLKTMYGNPVGIYNHHCK